MIKKIVMKNTASYGTADEQVIVPKIINFLFGLNGSGKTTISRYIASQADEKFRDCQILWQDAPIKCFVYNQDFVNKNFKETIPGIFTLGESTIEIKNKIKNLSDEKEKLQEIIDQKQREIGNCEDGDGYIQRLQNHENYYTNKFWEIKQELDQDKSPMIKAIAGVLGSKERFKEKLLSESAQNKSDLFDKNYLESLSTRLLGSTVEKQSFISLPSFDELIATENESLLKTSIVGKENVAISKLIEKLGNSAWVSQGKHFVDSSDGKCPFCQQELPENFSKQIEDYFDKTYETNMKNISALKSKYENLSRQIQEQIQILIDTPHSFLKIDFLEKENATLRIMLQKNIASLEKKISSPSDIVNLDSLNDIRQKIESLIQDANAAIKEHNHRVDNLKEEKEKLASHVWKYIITKLSSDIKSYSEKKKEIQLSISTAEKQRDEASKTHKDKSLELIEAEKNLSSIIPIANEINSILTDFGFTNFQLSVDNINKTYQFIRTNGEPAFESLSEGEKNFVTFLYFIHTLKGNTDDATFNEDKILIIDDPVSSLDQDVLFLVSTLIRDLFCDIYSEVSSIKQLFVFSHNLYFFKEVSYEKGIKKDATGYWMITKRNNITKIEEYEKNPISSTYEMLWDEVIRASKNPTNYNTVSLANSMRRIIEYYFKFLGGNDLNKFHRNFQDGDRQVFKALISWINAGSHPVFDDFSVATAQYDAEKFLSVFRKLFCETNHLSHYNMMMKTTTGENDGKNENADS